MNRSFHRAYRSGFVFSAIFFAVFGLVNTAAAGDCVVSKPAVSVGDVTVSADEVDAIRAGLGDFGRTPDRTEVASSPSVAVGQALMAAADVRGVRDILSGEARFAAASPEPTRTQSVSVGPVEVSSDELIGVRNGLGKAPAPTTGGCA